MFSFCFLAFSEKTGCMQKKQLDLKNIPERRGMRYPIMIGLRVSIETHNQLEELKRQNKDTTELLRMFIEEGLASVFEKQAS